MLTQRQIWLYWREFNAAKKARMNGRETFTKLEENQFRHECHIKALGADKSSKDFTNRDLDLVLGVFRAFSQPADLDGQLRQINMDRTRLHYGLRALIREMDLSDAYVAAIVHTMNENGQLGSNHVDQLSPADLRKVMIALREHQRRGTPLARNYEMEPERKFEPRHA